jgi:hypothetical protein
MAANQGNNEMPYYARCDVDVMLAAPTEHLLVAEVWVHLHLRYMRAKMLMYKDTSP